MSDPLNAAARVGAGLGGTGAAALASGFGMGGTSITISPGAITLTLGEGVDPERARAAFTGAADDIAGALLSALQRR